MQNTMWAARQRQHLAQIAWSYKWLKAPFIIGAPMRALAGPELAIEISAAGGLGFIGPPVKIADAGADLAKASQLARTSASPALSAHLATSGTLPVGIGFQTWTTALDEAVGSLQQHKPCAVWLFAPKRGQEELDEWTVALRKAEPEIQVWIQVGTLREAVAAAASSSPPDVLVVQGAEAGGHGRAEDGVGLQALFPEVFDATSECSIPLIAAGGIADGRGLAAALSLGAAGGAMGTRLLAANETRISTGYQNEVVRASDSATSTVRTHLYNHLRGTYGWPQQFAPRTVINRSWIDHQEGVSFDKLKILHDDAAKSGDAGWGPNGRLATYVGAAVGLVHDVKPAASIIAETRDEARAIFTFNSNFLGGGE
ncbi:oxidoreductase 2-nitropropane dioxygenase family [Cordyceps javanica]|uniref:Oxidoreductase 2-nitropropane dioxygenase family n=1 Tax=Cordyceps javanica TaxID=43265 RepID=A0A545VL01_9HYPO|nr:oxidoreductase 2-nitropropane dioxygenase family [Cordyceps javanica]TQW02385.1 oxidoreductase 2-nitropropane dioxygenase family [Cordyceps javanica]